MMHIETNKAPNDNLLIYQSINMIQERVFNPTKLVMSSWVLEDKKLWGLFHSPNNKILVPPLGSQGGEGGRVEKYPQQKTKMHSNYQ